MSTAEKRPITMALAGNANVGKSVIFNYLTGLHQHIGNWPGKTVEKAEGTLATIEIPDESGDYLPYADVAIRYSEAIVIIGEFEELVRELVPYLPDVVYRGDPLDNGEAIEVDAAEEEKARSLKKRAADLVDLGEEKKEDK